MKLFTVESYKELETRRPEFAVLPLGAFEQHGEHLPMTTDSLIAGELGRRLCERHNGLLLPPIPITCSHEHHGFFGSTWISATTLWSLMEDVAHSLAYSGITKLIIMNAHGGNYVINNFAQEKNLDQHRILLLPTRQHWQEALVRAGLEKTSDQDMHAGESETSILMYACPDSIRAQEVADHQADERPLLHLRGIGGYTESGIIGFPSLASADKGRKLLAELIACMDSAIQEFLTADRPGGV